VQDDKCTRTQSEGENVRTGREWSGHFWDPWGNCKKPPRDADRISVLLKPCARLADELNLATASRPMHDSRSLTGKGDLLRLRNNRTQSIIAGISNVFLGVTRDRLRAFVPTALSV
jgi:hypothetical protein